MSPGLNQLPETRQTILLAIKQKGTATINELAAQLGMTREAVRQQLMQLEGDGWVEKHTKRDANNGGGRPSMHYSITSKGEYLFPKNYDYLAIELLDTVVKQLGMDALKQILAAMTEARVREWEPRLHGLNLEQRIEALKEIYLSEDTYMDVEKANGYICLVERNCPFYHVAKERPVICSVTISVLTRLLGFRVEREKKIQNGDGRCAFRVLLDQPVDSSSFRFALED